MDSEAICKMLRSVLQSSKTGVAISSLQAEYRSLCGETIPVKKLGFCNLEDYLRSIPSVVRLESRLGSLVCFAAVCKETAHIAELVARQKSSKKAGRSQLVNCKMRFKPSNPYALNVKPKTSLRQPSNYTSNRRPAHNYRGFSASGDVRQLTLSGYFPVQQRPPPTQQPTKLNCAPDNKENRFQVDQRVPDKLNHIEERAERSTSDFNVKLEQARLSEVLSIYSSGLWMSKLPVVYYKMFNQHPHPQTLLELDKWTHICSLEETSIANRADRLIYPPHTAQLPTTNKNINGPTVSPSSPVSTPLSSRPLLSPKSPANALAPVPKSRGVPRSPLTKPTFICQQENIGDGWHFPSLQNSLNSVFTPQSKNRDFRDNSSSFAVGEGQIQQPKPTPPSVPSLLQTGPDILSLLKASCNTKSDPALDKPAVFPAATSLDVRRKVKELLLKYSSGLWIQALPKLFEDTFKIPLPENFLDDLSLWGDFCSVEYPVPNDKRKAILYYSCRNDPETTEEKAHPLPSGLEMVGSIVPPRLALPSEQYPSVLITDAKSSNAVTVRYVGKNYSNAQEAMEEAMRSFYSEISSSSYLSKVTIGQLVAVKGEDEDDVSRAQVIEVISPHKVKLYYLDYGCSSESNTQNLRELHQNFLSLPFQAINVKLAGIECFNSHPLVLSYLEKTAVGKILLMETLEPCQYSEVPLVVLYDTSQEEDLNINLSCLKALQDDSMNNPLTINVTYQDVCVTNVCADGVIICQLPSRGMARLCKLLEKTEAFFKTQVTSESLVSRPFCGKLCLVCYKGKWSRVEIINIYSNRVLEILLIDHGLTLTIEVTELREIPPPFLKDLIIIPAQAIRCSLEGVHVPEGGWSPEAVKWVKELLLGLEAAKMKIVKLEEHEGNKLVHVHLFIGTNGVKIEDSINHQLAQSELWQKLVTKHISNCSLNKVPVANVNQTVKAGSKVISTKTMAQSSMPQSLPPLLDLPQPGQNIDVFVPVACHPGYFVLQPWQDLHKLVVLLGEMVLYYNKTKTSSETEIKKGNIYAAEIDKNWHRVLVKGILSNGLISVYELDHGKHELVRRSAIQPLIEEFSQLPFQAITAQLAGLSRLQWSEEASMVFRNHVEKRALVALVDSVKEAPDIRGAPWERRLTVYLVDTTMDERDLWIHSIMADMSGELSSAA